jgi:hypothetical protein
MRVREEYDNNGDEYVSQQSPQQYSTASQEGDTVSEDLDQMIDCATTKALPFTAATGPLGAALGGLACGFYAGSD